MRLTVKLESEIIIQLQSIFQTATYSGWLEGRFSGQKNQEFLNVYQNEANVIWPGEPIHTLNLNHYLSNPEIRLPDVKCMGLFICCDPAIDKKKMASSLVVIWFQDTIAPHLSPENQILLQKIDWRELARDFDW